MKYSSVVMERIYTSLTQGLEGGGGVLYEKVPLLYTFFLLAKRRFKPQKKRFNFTLFFL